MKEKNNTFNDIITTRGVVMNKCIIGILPSYYCENENPYSEYYKYNCIFARKLLEAGGVPVGMMFNGNKLDYKVLDLYDGFLITGGNKINDFVYEILYYAYENNKTGFRYLYGS